MKHIQGGATDLEAAFDHGYESLSGFRDAFQKTFGVTPVKSKNVTAILTRTIDSPVGPLVACATDDGVCLLEFADRRALQRQVETLKSRLHGVVAIERATSLSCFLSSWLTYESRREGFRVGVGQCRPRLPYWRETLDLTLVQ